MVCKSQAVRHNVESLATYCRASGALLAPHMKTSMSPELVQLQLAAGAWGVTAATVSQARVARRFGVRNVLLANQLVDPAAIAGVVADLKQHVEHGFLCYVDSLEGAALLASELAGSDVVLDVLLEMGQPGGRTGSRTMADARLVAEAVAQHPQLHLVGVAGYEGSIGSDREGATLAAVRAQARSWRMLRSAGGGFGRTACVWQ